MHTYFTTYLQGVLLPKVMAFKLTQIIIFSVNEIKYKRFFEWYERKHNKNYFGKSTQSIWKTQQRFCWFVQVLTLIAKWRCSLWIVMKTCPCILLTLNISSTYTMYHIIFLNREHKWKMCCKLLAAYLFLHCFFLICFLFDVNPMFPVYTHFTTVVSFMLTKKCCDHSGSMV